MTVTLAPAAEETLDEIWAYNLERSNSPRQADEYREFLMDSVRRLATEHPFGREIGGSGRRYAIFKRPGARHGHLAVYEVGEESVVVLAFFHTAQDWRARIEDPRDE